MLCSPPEGTHTQTDSSWRRCSPFICSGSLFVATRRHIRPSWRLCTSVLGGHCVRVWACCKMATNFQRSTRRFLLARLVGLPESEQDKLSQSLRSKAPPSCRVSVRARQWRAISISSATRRESVCSCCCCWFCLLLVGACKWACKCGPTGKCTQSPVNSPRAHTSATHKQQHTSSNTQSAA